MLTYINSEYLAGNPCVTDLNVYRKMAHDYFEYKSNVYGEPWTERELHVISTCSERKDLILDTARTVFNQYCALTKMNYSFVSFLEEGYADISQTVDAFFL